MRRKVVRGAIILSAIAIVAYGAIRIPSLIIRGSSDRLAIYSGVRFYGYPNFVKVSADNGALENVYVQLSDGDRYKLSELPEDEVAEYCERHDMRNHPIRPQNQVIYTYGGNMLTYGDRGLLMSVFEFPKEKFLFSPSIDGPYLQLPATLEQLEEVFGEPDAWERPGHSGPKF